MEGVKKDGFFVMELMGEHEGMGGGGYFGGERGGGGCGKNGPAQICTGYISVAHKNRQEGICSTEELMVTSRRKLQHGVDKDDIRKSIVTNFADTNNTWLHHCSVTGRSESVFHVLSVNATPQGIAHLVQKQFID